MKASLVGLPQTHFDNHEGRFYWTFSLYPTGPMLFLLDIIP